MFAPAVAEIYPDGFATTVTVGGLGDVLEGAERGPGHFAGVCTVVCKLFTIVAPDVAFFGQKDAQQVVVVRRMARDLNLPGADRRPCRPCARPTASPCPPATPGWARPTASAPPRCTRAWRPRAPRCAAGERDARAAEAAGVAAMRAAGVEPEYLAVVDPDTLEPVRTRDAERVLVVVAARVGPARLIDNLPLDLEPVATP